MQTASGQHYQKYIHKSAVGRGQLSHCVGQTLNPKVKGNKKLGGGGGGGGTVVIFSIRVIVKTDFFPELVFHFASETI